MTFTEWSKRPPQHPCFAIFRGLRATRSGRVNELYEPVQIVWTWRGRTKELAVARMRQQGLTPLADLSGEWQELILREPVAGLAAFVGVQP